MNKLKAAVLVICLAAWGHQPGHAQAGRTTWTDYGGSADNARHFTSNQINRSNLDQLRVAWTYATNDNISYVFNPIIVDNMMYVLARNNSLVAIDATTGQEIWVHEGLQGIAPRGINYWESKDRSDRRLLFQLNSYLQAIDARTGKSILTFGKNGAVNLREGLRRDPATVVKTQSSQPGKGVREPHHPWIGRGRKLHGASRRCSRLRRRDWRARLAVPHDSRIRASSAMRPGHPTRGNTSEASIPGARLPSIPSEASRTFRSVLPPTISTAPIVTAPTCSARRSSR